VVFSVSSRSKNLLALLIQLRLTRLLAKPYAPFLINANRCSLGESRRTKACSWAKL